MNANASIPANKTDHIFRFTDDCGMFQHSICGLPNRVMGHTPDDNARALHSEIIEQSDLKVIYTQLNGSGSKPVRAVLKRAGVKGLTIVSEQIIRMEDSRRVRNRISRSIPSSS